jgi:RNA polymerase primary sigma factor
MRSSAMRHQTESSVSDSLTTYLGTIRAYPLLTRSEEIPLARRIHDGDATALEQLVCANLRFVVSVAKKYQHRGVLLSDLINDGNLGLIRAAEKFDEAKGVRFLSYAVWWIRQAIFQALADQAHTVRLPLGLAGSLHRISRRASALRQELGREPTQHELSTDLDISEATIANAMPMTRSNVSLDGPIGRGDNKLADYLPDDLSPVPGEDVVVEELEHSVTAALTGLTAREAKVLRLYFGFDANDAMTLEEIGALLGVTRERVRQIKDKALMRIRKSKQGHSLASFCER